MVRPHDRLQRNRPGRFQAQHAPPGVVQKERLHKMTDTQTQALAKIDEGAKAAGFGRVADAMKDFVATALRDFIRQDAEFAQAVAQGGSFKDCMASVCKKIKGNAISGLEAYKAAVEFYFPGAAVSMKMNIDLCGDASGEAAPTPEPGKGMIIDLSAFF